MGTINYQYHKIRPAELIRRKEDLVLCSLLVTAVEPRHDGKREDGVCPEVHHVHIDIPTARKAPDMAMALFEPWADTFKPE